MLAIGTMILIDKEPGALSRMSVEGIARRARGIVEAWKKVERDTDWTKPPSAGKAWKSKVCCEETRRTSSSLADEPLFKLRRLDGEAQDRARSEPAEKHQANWRSIAREASGWNQTPS